MATLQQLLAPQVILESITSRIKQPGDALQRFLGMSLAGGPAVLDNSMYMRYAAYDIFDSIQDIATFRMPGTGPATRARQGVGQVPVTIPRMHEKVPLMYEELGNLRPLGKTSGNIDTGGRDYITRQETILKQYFQNAREFLCASLLRGAFTLTQSNENWVADYSGGEISIDYQIPSGNKSQLNMLAAGSIIAISWDNTASAQIFENLLAINSAYWSLHGWPLEHIWCDSVMWGYVTANTGIKARSGTSNVVFDEFKRVSNYDDQERARDGFEAKLKCLPMISWHVYDGGTKVGTSSTFTKFVPSTAIAGLPTPQPQLYQLLVGGEYVVEQDGMPATVKRGLNFWPKYTSEPSRVEIVGLDNAIPISRVPKSQIYGTVVF